MGVCKCILFEFYLEWILFIHDLLGWNVSATICLFFDGYVLQRKERKASEDCKVVFLYILSIAFDSDLCSTGYACRLVI